MRKDLIYNLDIKGLAKASARHLGTSENGNPTASNLFDVIYALEKKKRFIINYTQRNKLLFICGTKWVIAMVKKLQTTFHKWLADPEIKEHFDKDYKNFVLSELTAVKKVKKLLKAIKKNPKRLNCVATEKCQINFEQR